MEKFRFGFLLVLALLNGCSSPSVPTPEPIGSADELKQALIAAGAEVVALESPGLVLPGVQVQSWEVSGEPIYVLSGAERIDGEQLQDHIIQMGVNPDQREQELQTWEHESFTVVYSGSDGGVVLLISGLLGDPITQQLSGPDEPYPPAISAAQHVLAEELGLAPSAVQVVDYTDVLWPDSCLGIVVPDQACAQVETPGWRIELSANGTNYLMHTDAIGQRIMRAE